MQAAVLQQEHYPPKVDEIFPASALLIIPDLTQIFRQQKRRFKKRTSSAIWETPPSKYFRFRSPKLLYDLEQLVQLTTHIADHGDMPNILDLFLTSNPSVYAVILCSRWTPPITS
ncbi:Inner centromere protein [Portunus trituberculatus]|uniref:Inner centromere protein n=1 Tax=Portunus trituberculatus TaxID=210409 RepID=A0A5B7CSH4_PORTR|nr:Inner centromere protein [Portunus trituberculatus]